MKLGIVYLSILVITASCTSAAAGVTSKECGIAEMLSGTSCITPDLIEISKHKLGTEGNPVKADGPTGERSYISKLICLNGEPVAAFSRVGSTGVGPYGFIMDIYTVQCDTTEGVKNYSVFMDMYHKNFVETLPAENFSAVKR